MVEASAVLEQGRFAHVWRGLGARDDGGPVFAWLVAQYAAPTRAYHTQEHIAECLAWLDRVRTLAEHPLELEAAIWFHDAVYEVPASDNEARSGELAVEHALSSGIAAGSAARIAALIACTTHAAHADGADARLLVDIDLSILGAPPHRYQRFERDVRREYAIVPDELFREGRVQVLNSFLERFAIYETPYFSERLERQARENLSAAIARLRSDDDATRAGYGPVQTGVKSSV
jgi:predicted metal-dependent HD superfamily phosphohydrolase